MRLYRTWMYHESYRHHKNIDATSDDAGVIREILNFNCIDADLSAGFSGELGRSKFWKDQTTNPNFSSGSQTTEAFIFLCGSFFEKHWIDAIDATIDQRYQQNPEKTGWIGTCRHEWSSGLL